MSRVGLNCCHPSLWIPGSHPFPPETSSFQQRILRLELQYVHSCNFSDARKNGENEPQPVRRITRPGLYGNGSLKMPRGFTRAPSTSRLQCRCGPVARPVAPTTPRTAPTFTSSPSATFIDLM